MPLLPYRAIMGRGFSGAPNWRRKRCRARNRSHMNLAVIGWGIIDTNQTAVGAANAEA